MFFKDLSKSFSKSLSSRREKSRGMVLSMVLMVCLVLGFLAFEAEGLALYHHNQVRLVQVFRGKMGAFS